MQNDACLLFAVLISNNTRRSRPGILHHNAVSLKLLDRDNKCLSIVELALRQRGTWRYNRYLTFVGKQVRWLTERRTRKREAIRRLRLPTDCLLSGLVSALAAERR